MFYNDCYGYGYPTVINTGGSNGNGAWGSDGIWAILLLALLGGFGGRGYGGGYGAGNEFVGYELGKVATQADVASGFNNSSVLSNQNDLKLAIANGFAGVDNAICTLGYQNQQGFNQISREIADCCCTTQRAIDSVNFNAAKNTCEIIQAINCANQRLIDIYTNDKIDTLNRKLSIAEGQISQAAQTNVLLNAINRTPVAAYTVPNPYCCYNTCGYNNGGCVGIQ